MIHLNRRKYFVNMLTTRQHSEVVNNYDNKYYTDTGSISSLVSGLSIVESQNIYISTSRISSSLTKYFVPRNSASEMLCPFQRLH